MDIIEKSHNRRAIVIGGSIAGLFVGAFLRRIGWRVDVYERSSIELIGRGVGIFATHFLTTTTSSGHLPLTMPCASRSVNVSFRTAESSGCNSASRLKAMKIADSRNCYRALKAYWIGSQSRISWPRDPEIGFISYGCSTKLAGPKFAHRVAADAWVGLGSVLENSGHNRPAPRDGLGANDPNRKSRRLILVSCGRLAPLTSPPLLRRSRTVPRSPDRRSAGPWRRSYRRAWHAVAPPRDRASGRFAGCRTSSW